MALTLALFSPFGGGELLLGTADGRLRTYDSGTGRLRAILGENKESAASASTSGLTNGHLTERHTCLAWAQGSRKEKKKKGASLLAIVGTAAGDVKAYNTQLGELVWRASNCIEGGVASLAYSSKDGLVYAAGADCRICTLDVLSGAVQLSFKASKHPISCIALSPDSQHIFGGSSSLALWDSSSQERVGKFTGHPTPVRAIAFAPDGSHAASVGTGERSLALWPTTSAPPPTASPSAPTSSSGKKAKRGGLRAAVSSLPCPDPVVTLDACSSGSSGGGDSSPSDFHLAGVSESGDAYVWHCMSAPSTSGRQANEGQASVEGHLVAHIRVDAVKGSQSSSQGEGQPSETIMAVQLQPGTEGPVLLIARGTSAKPAFQSIPLSQQHIQQQRQPAGGDGGSAAEIVLQAQTGGVLLGSTVVEKGANGNSAGEHVKGSKPGKLQHSKQGVTVLGPENQRCLATSNSRVIHNTVARIVPRDAALFLRAAVDRLLSRPARAGQLAPWLRALLHHHTGYLMAAPGAQAPLAALYQAIDGRVALYQQLLRLYGRLGLITAHSKKAGVAGDGEAGAAGPEPEVVFEDASDDDDEPDVEDPFALEGAGEGDSESEGDEGSSGEGRDDDLMGDEDDDFEDEDSD
ncbi:quinon protein alcohol dehydrogenase-like superfamily [Dunaliella salina]|uniref:Quinon protein alcohol dehydrogenase-like superfamily n=1 Tax=Dunaliella salina TaxID=3046 RepID=A0ABQ7GZ95_DUNSA|nr:quinon protein alcohol dehydrogenase-like superfamily [Dunaliella salina]|eukprot:KAF5839935.1 quinon protein alcohol dehydrogenase-like superfamily [Dunaliella salina]